MKALNDGGGINKVAIAQNTGEVWIQLCHRRFKLCSSKHPNIGYNLIKTNHKKLDQKQKI